MNHQSSVFDRLALGTVQFGMNYGVANQEGKIACDKVGTILEFAQCSGIDMLDTAIAYGDSERCLGDIGVQSWQVISKLPALPDDCTDISKWVKDALSKSLQKLKVESLYGLLLHKPGQLLEQHGEELFQVMQQLKYDGIVKKIGVSIYHSDELDKLFTRYQFDIVQAPFNIIDRRLIDTNWIYRLSELGTELHARSIFLQGLLLMSARDRPQKFNKWASLWSKWDAWLKHAELTPLEACLRYVLSFSLIGKVIVGIDNINQLKEIIHAMSGTLLEVPDDLQCNDVELLNPALWSGL